jgi:hypothetical protein
MVWSVLENLRVYMCMYMCMYVYGRRKTREDDGRPRLPFQANSTCVAEKPAMMMARGDYLFKQTARASP